MSVLILADWFCYVFIKYIYAKLGIRLYSKRYKSSSSQFENYFIIYQLDINQLLIMHDFITNWIT